MANQFNKVIHEIAREGTGRTCPVCKKHLTHESFNQYGNPCKVCHNSKYRRRESPFVVYANEPLKIATYETRIVQGFPMQVRVERVSGS